MPLVHFLYTAIHNKTFLEPLVYQKLRTNHIENILTRKPCAKTIIHKKSNTCAASVLGNQIYGYNNFYNYKTITTEYS